MDLVGAPALPASYARPSARKERGPQDDKVNGIAAQVYIAPPSATRCLDLAGVAPHSFLHHFGTFLRLIMLIRLFFASICMYNPARLDFI